MANQKDDNNIAKVADLRTAITLLENEAERNAKHSHTCQRCGFTPSPGYAAQLHRAAQHLKKELSDKEHKK